MRIDTMTCAAGASQMTDREALALSRRMAEPDTFPEARQAFARSLFDYYKTILKRTERPTIPTPRRWL